MYPFLEKYSIPHKKTGKIIVATDQQKVAVLEDIYEKACRKGLKGLEWLSHNRVSELEPDIRCVAGVLSPETGILSAHRYMDVLLSEFQQNGGFFIPNTEFRSITRLNNRMSVNLYTLNEGMNTAQTRYVINAAGLHSSDVSAKAGFQDVPQVYFCKGHYYKVRGARNRFSHLIYPVPDKTYLGTHMTLDLQGELKLGPDAVYLDKNREDYSTFLSTRQPFIDNVEKFWPFVGNHVIVEDMTGIRPKLYSENMPAEDFVIRDEGRNGYPHWISMYGIESPGLTASMAFGPYIQNEILRID